MCLVVLTDWACRGISVSEKECICCALDCMHACILSSLCLWAQGAGMSTIIQLGSTKLLNTCCLFIVWFIKHFIYIHVGAGMDLFCFLTLFSKNLRLYLLFCLVSWLLKLLWHSLYPHVQMSFGFVKQHSLTTASQAFVSMCLLS